MLGGTNECLTHFQLLHLIFAIEDAYHNVVVFHFLSYQQYFP